MTADRHELLCAYDDCDGRLPHLLDDVGVVSVLLREILENYGITGQVDREDIVAIRRAYRRLSESTAR